MTLYNLKTDGDQWRITKFDDDLNVESSYLLSRDECECPAGHRVSCRHRQMLPEMLVYDMANTGMFYDFDTKVVLTPMPTLPEGVTMLSLDDPAEVHNAIADAVGEPEAKLVHPTIGPMKRRI